MKFNPFRPNSLISPGMFVGRSSEIDSIEKCLLQTKNENPQHFLILGERGIGKSSLLFYIEAISQFIENIDDNPFNFMPISVDLSACSTNIDILRAIARRFRSAISARDNIKDTAKSVWDWISNWEVLGIRFHKVQIENPTDFDEILDEFVDNLSNFCRLTRNELDGILVLIDEADNPQSDADLGRTIKFITERLSRRGCERVIFGIAGLPTLLVKLRESHESAPRLFHAIKLEPLEWVERRQVVQLGLEEANRKNPSGTLIDDDALDFLADLSEGYPHFLQQFSYSAFDIDEDGLIDVEDVSDGAFGENGALSQLGRKFFDEMYNARISSEDYRRVLDSMAEHGDEWVSRKRIIAESGVSETSVTNALKALRDKEIILPDDSRRGFYRLPTRSFAAWINALRQAKAKSDVERSAD